MKKEIIKTQVENMLQAIEQLGFEPYTISIWEIEVKLQGEFNSSVIKKCNENGYNMIVEPTNGHIECVKDGIKITLTE